MKLFRYGAIGQEKPAVVLPSGKKIDVSHFTNDYDEAFFTHKGILALQQWLATHANECAAVAETERIGAPIARPSKIVCVGLNYVTHAEESEMNLPAEPVLFLKSTTALCGAYDNLILPPESKKTDWEAELALVISKKCLYVKEEDALNYVAGYCMLNDYSERAYQHERGGQWVKGKSCDSFAPLGPYLITPDEITNVNALSIVLKVNGTIMQNGNTADMIFKIPFLISYISHFMTLLPGDVISTGTPSGVGFGQKPNPVYLKHGDIVEYSITALGTAKQIVQ